MKDSNHDGENPAHDGGDQLVVQVVEVHRLRLGNIFHLNLWTFKGCFCFVNFVIFTISSSLVNIDEGKHLQKL